MQGEFEMFFYELPLNLFKTMLTIEAPYKKLISLGWIKTSDRTNGKFETFLPACTLYQYIICINNQQSSDELILMFALGMCAWEIQFVDTHFQYFILC